MSRIWHAGVALTLGLVAACVTINVYFPAAAAEEAADQVIQSVWGEDAQDEPDERSLLDGFAPATYRLARGFVDLLIPPVHAQTVNIDISSPGVRRIQNSMRSRHEKSLKPYWDSGAIGLTADAMVTIRELGAVPLPERNRLRKLVSDENDDRVALYREIANANGHPEWENQIRATFAQRWVAKASRGWYFRDSKGNWQRK